MREGMRQELLADAERIVREAESLSATHFYALISGGKDSITAADVVSRIRPLDGVLFIDTTIGLAETRAFVEAFCAERNWPLTILRPTKSYDEIVAKYGFPGPSMHRYTYIYLKWHPIAAWGTSTPQPQASRAHQRTTSHREQAAWSHRPSSGRA